MTPPALTVSLSGLLSHGSLLFRFERGQRRIKLVVTRLLLRIRLP
jgi:hypothetical protein